MVETSEQPDPCFWALRPSESLVLVQVKGTAETPIGPATGAFRAAQDAYERLVSASIGVKVEPPQARYEIALRHESDTGYARQAVAKEVLRVLGHGVLTEDYRITLNDIPLSPELVEEALAPTVVYKV